MEKITKNKIDLRSESVQEIIGSTPKWIIRKGISVITLVFFIILIGSYFYKYPDIIIANITLTTTNPPTPIIAKTSGIIDSIFVKDNELVDEEQSLGIMENSAKYSDIIKLKKNLEYFKSFFTNIPKIIEVKFDNNYQLGIIHNDYAAFITQWNYYQTTLKVDYIGEQIESLKKQSYDYVNYLIQLQEQVNIFEKDILLSEKLFKRDSVLFTKGVLSENIFENSKSVYLKQVYSFKGSLANLTNTKLKINQIQQQILEYKVKQTEQNENIISNLKEKFELLNNQLNTWEQTYLLKSPVKGKITYTNVWSSNQYVSAGSLVFTIIAEKKQNIIGRINIPLTGSGKVKKGQMVNIKLINYPYIEYGMLQGKITNISLVPISNDHGVFYAADVSLINNLTTNYKIELPFNQEMQGVCEIITDDRRLIHRFIEPIMALFKEKI